MAHQVEQIFGNSPDPPWTQVPTEEPLSPDLRAEVKSELQKFFHFDKMGRYRKMVKWSCGLDDFDLVLKGPSVWLDLLQIGDVCNKLAAFYWMPSTAFDGYAVPLLPFGCIFNQWLKYHDGQPNIEFRCFFAHLVRVYPSGPATVQGIVDAHREFCAEAISLLERIESGEEAREYGGGPWKDLQNYKIMATYRAVVIMMDEYLEPQSDGDYDTLIDLEEHSKKQNVLLARTGDDSHLKSPVSFESLRVTGLCLPLARTDLPDTSDDVVKVSIATAVKFVTDLQQREHTTFPEPKDVLNMDRNAKEWAEETLEEADEEGIDNHPDAWDTVRRVKATRRGEPFPAPTHLPFNKHWRE